MRKLLFSVCFFLLNFNGMEVRGQEIVIEKQIDSLDKIQPEVYHTIKPKGNVYIIRINNQKQFNDINDEISKAVSAGEKNVKVIISKGVYRFHENHINRINEQASDVSITIIGKKAILTSDNNYHPEKELISPWSDLVVMDSVIEVIDNEKKQCFIPFSKINDICDNLSGFTKVQITQWFRAPIYSVTRIDGNGIYFTAPNLAWSNIFEIKGYNLNYDYLYLGKIPRFRIYNEIFRHHCEASCFVKLNNCKYRLFEIKGISFASNDSNGALISVNNVEAQQIKVSNCSFEYIRGNVVNASETGNVVFDHNTVCNTDGNEVRFINNCPNIRITNNYFRDCGRSLGQTFCVTCWESSYFISNNIFCDFGYAAIGVGMWHGFEKKHYSGGIIEHNEIFFTPKYFSKAWRHMLMDSGTIYTWTQNDNVIIRYNYIHDYTGAGDNRGIFCDDGSNNLKIYRNIIQNIPNSYCIDSRYSKDLKEGFRNNENNFMAQNIVDGSIRYMGYENEERHVVKGANILLQKDVNQIIENDYKGIETFEGDIVISCTTTKYTKKVLPQKYRSAFKRVGVSRQNNFKQN